MTIETGFPCTPTIWESRGGGGHLSVSGLLVWHYHLLGTVLIREKALIWGNTESTKKASTTY